MGFDAAGVRAASAGLGVLAERARANGQAILHAAHEAARLPEDRVGGGFRAGAKAYLGSPEGKAAMRTALEAGWALLRGMAGGAPPAPKPAVQQQPAVAAAAAQPVAAAPSPQVAAAPEHSGTVA